MTGPSAVSPTSLNPEWDITLTDGTDSVGIVLVDGNGTRNHRAIQRTPFGNRTALKTAQGVNKYEDYELPYMSIPQDDWSGGLGKLDLDDDASRYYEVNGLNTLSGKATLSGMPKYWTGIRSEKNGLNDGSQTWEWVSLGTTYYAAKFTPTSNFTSEEVLIRVKHGDATGNITAYLYSHSVADGVPDSVLATSSAVGITQIPESGREMLLNFNIAYA